MAKLTKTQLNRIQERLENIRHTKLDDYQATLPTVTTDFLPITIDWIKKNPVTFAKLFIKHFSTDGYVTSATLYGRIPTTVAAQKEADDLRKKNAKLTNAANQKLRTAITATMDSLYFSDASDPTKAIADFEKLSL